MMFSQIRTKIHYYVRAILNRLHGQRAMRARTRALQRGSLPLPPPDGTPQLDTALVIPVLNDQAGLDHVLAQARAMRCFTQLVVIDDGSQPAMAVGPDVTLLRHETAQGPGTARNAGLIAVTTQFVLFFDADDYLMDDLPHLMADLARHTDPFDFCMFKHADSRLTDDGRWGQPYADERWWQASGLQNGALQPAPPASWPQLARTSNYPWNKVYRAAFLRDNAIACGTTQVHEDIALHWHGFLAAHNVLVSDRGCAWHYVPANGNNQTNRKGPERLAVFPAMAPIAARVAAQDNDMWRAALADFGLGVVAWNRTQIAPAHLPALDQAEHHYLQTTIAPWQDAIARIDPVLARRITAQLARAI